MRSHKALSEIDQNSKDYFIDACIRKGASDITLLMGATYLSQFEHLDSTFALRPLFPPSFLVSSVPYSLELLGMFNEATKRLGFDRHEWSGRKLLIPSEGSLEIVEGYLKEHGAQLFELYQLNAKNLTRFENCHLGLFNKVRECSRRDETIRGILSYHELPRVIH